MNKEVSITDNVLGERIKELEAEIARLRDAIGSSTLQKMDEAAARRKVQKASE